MLALLEENEMQAATKLIFDGLSMAKQSMQMILQTPITMEEIDYGQDPNTVKYKSTKKGKVHVIKTDLKGQLRGTSHLIFTEDEVNSIFKACLPAKIVNDTSPQSQVMKIGFLTEIDNMVAAAVITEFSNFLGLDLFGHVPSLQVMEAEELETFLAKESSEYNSVVHFKALFHGSELNISPDFVWIFQDEFVTKLKAAV